MDQISASIETANKAPSGFSPCTVGDKMDSLDPASQPANLTPTHTDFPSQVTGEFQADDTPSVHSESHNQRSISQSVDTGYAAEQSGIDDNGTTRSEANRINPTDSTGEPSIASTSSVNSLATSIADEDNSSIKGFELLPFSMVASELGEGLNARQLGLLQILEDKWRRRTQYRRKIKHEPHPRTPEALLQLLRPVVPEGSTEVLEEDIHSWGSTPTSLYHLQGPLMRLFDHASQSRIDNCDEGFLSGASDTLLFYRESRGTAVQNHASWESRRKSPFVSTSTSIQDIKYRASRLKRRHQSSHGPFSAKLSLINPRARLKSGMTMLKMPEELSYYKVAGSAKPSCYENEIIMLFRIPRNEIIKTYLWRDIEEIVYSKGISFEQWYETYAMAEFREHESNRLAGKENPSIGIWNPGESTGGKRAFVRACSESGEQETETDEESDSDGGGDRKCRCIEVSNE